MTDEEALEVTSRITRKRWFNYDTADHVFEMLDFVYRQPRGDRMDNLLIWGETNSGKTHLVRKFLRKFAIGATDILFVTCPDKAIEGRLWNKMLRALKVPYKATEIASVKRDAVEGRLEDLSIRLIILDNVNNLIASTKGMQCQFLITLREMSTDNQFAIAATGMCCHADDT